MAPERTSGIWVRLEAQYGRTRVRAIAVILLIGGASIAIRLLNHYNFHQSALLYIGIPYLISLTIALMRPAVSDGTLWHQYRDHLLTALIVFMTSSIVLFEGFICVLFFLPIYILVVTVTFGIRWRLFTYNKRRGSTFIHLLPLIILVASLEGTSDTFSVERNAQVVVTKMTDLSIDQIKRNLAEPFDLQQDRHWLLSIFPMPYQIDAGSLNPGDVHSAYTRYHRWFVTNTHEGELRLQIVDVEPQRVSTRFIHDTTFFSSYLTPIGTEIKLKEITLRSTEISLRIDYRRNLDPAWYFHPLQQYAVGKMAEFLIDEVMIRE